MCVLGRPFGLRQMVKNGKHVILMRDLTDTMYNPRKAPYVSHFSGTDRVIEHVERYVCPSATSDQILGGGPFRFKDDLRPRVAFLIAEDEYKTEATLPAFAAKHLARDFLISFIFDREGEKNSLTGLGALDEADVLVVSARRRVFPAEQLAFDAEVLGGNYQNHHKAGPMVTIAVVAEASGHPILTGVDVSNLVSSGTLYMVSPLARSATPLLTGTIPGQPSEPVAWTNLTASGGRVIYTSLGHPDDVSNAAFGRLLRNAITWASRREVTATEAQAATDPIPFPR
jgi:hypothetical protein